MKHWTERLPVPLWTLMAAALVLLALLFLTLPLSAQEKPKPPTKAPVLTDAQKQQLNALFGTVQYAASIAQYTSDEVSKKQTELNLLTHQRNDAAKARDDAMTKAREFLATACGKDSGYVVDPQTQTCVVKPPEKPPGGAQ